MTKIMGALLFLGLVLSACSPAALTPEDEPPLAASGAPTPVTSVAPVTELSPSKVIPVSTPELLPPKKIIATVSTPHIGQGPDDTATPADYASRNCGYQWAYQDLPELSTDFQSSLQSLQPEARGHAFAFGENCVYADGTATFIPMETDFNVTLQVSALDDEAALGEWIVKVMQVIENIPPGQIIGPRPGRVGILFESNGEKQDVGFYVDRYRALPAGLSPAEIYQTLKSSQ